MVKTLNDMDENFFIREDRRKIAQGDAICAYPLAGLIADKSHFSLNEVNILSFNRHEWWTVEKSAFIDDWLFECMNNRPLWAYFSVPSVISNQGTCSFLVDTLIESLRLYKSGFILEPRYTVSCIYDNGSSSRLPGIYRARYIEAIWGEENKARCLHINSQEFKHIESFFYTILWLKVHKPLLVTKLLELFSIIHVPTIQKSVIVHNLLICFEILFGSSQDYSKYNSYPNERAIKLLQNLGEESSKLNNFLLNESRTLRNKLHHGKKIDKELLTEYADILEQVIRSSMKSYFNTIIKIFNPESDLSYYKSLSLKLKPKEIFNKILSQ